MNPIPLTCSLTGASFPWTAEDQILLDRLCPQVDGNPYPLPLPTLCPLERKRRRLAFRNERTLYQRTSSLSAKPIISMYAPDCPFPVLAKEEYWSDACDARSYGQSFDFSKSLFEQLQALKVRVPRVALISDPDAEKNNCAYINCAGFSKNCYMAFNADQNQDCYYISSTFYCKDCVDCGHLQHCELCYECLNCTRCWDLRHAQDCTDCSSSSFLFCCVGCSDCYCCANLVKRQYCIKNQQYSKEEYFAALAARALCSRSALAQAEAEFQEFLSEQPRRYAQILRSENCTGNYILDSKDCHDCYHVRESRDLRHADVVHSAKDCMDLSAFGVGIELVYNSTSIGVGSSRIYFSFACVMNSSDLFYCDECRQSQHCLGCISLKRSQYCILNQQYSRDEYLRLLPRVIEHLRETGEWGQFFPHALSPFGYNESVAQERFPLTAQEAKARGIPWRVADKRAAGAGSFNPEQVPDSILQTSDASISQPLVCAQSGRAYRVSKAEFNYYKKQRIPLPVLCPDVRHAAREARSNKEQLWARCAARTGEEVLTTYPPEFKGEVLSERGYHQLIG